MDIYGQFYVGNVIFHNFSLLQIKKISKIFHQL